MLPLSCCMLRKCYWFINESDEKTASASAQRPYSLSASSLFVLAAALAQLAAADQDGSSAASAGNPIASVTSSGSISGNITNGSGQPLEGIQVTVY